MKQEKEVEEEVECWLVFLFLLFASGFLLLLCSRTREAALLSQRRDPISQDLIVVFQCRVLKLTEFAP